MQGLCRGPGGSRGGDTEALGSTADYVTLGSLVSGSYL